MPYSIPRPQIDERPTTYAERVGQWCASRTAFQKSLGQYFTPIPVAEFMAHLLTPSDNSVRVLDPGAGVGILSCARCEAIAQDIDLVAYEMDHDLIDGLDACLCYVQQWMKKCGVASGSLVSLAAKKVRGARRAEGKRQSRHPVGDDGGKPDGDAVCAYPPR